MTPAAIRDGLRRAAQRRDDAAARRRRRVPLGSRLARRHQRHARDDGVQLEVGRLPADDRRPRADADARDPGRARGEDPRVRAARLLGGRRHVPRRRRRVHGPLVRREVQEAPRTIPTRAPSACGTRRARAALADKCAGKPGIVTEESKPSTQIPPLLYDLTSLQREANGRFGFSARTTLSLAQALYEKHKVLTYPRTDSRALPEDYIGTVNVHARGAGARPTPSAAFAREILKQKWVRPNKRIFDNTKISDHFAIIPTLVRPKHLNEVEAQALRPRRAALPRGVLSGGRASRHDAHHARRGRAVQDRGQGARAARAGSPCTARKRRATRRRWRR